VFEARIREKAQELMQVHEQKHHFESSSADETKKSQGQTNKIKQLVHGFRGRKHRSFGRINVDNN